MIFVEKVNNLLDFLSLICYTLYSSLNINQEGRTSQKTPLATKQTAMKKIIYSALAILFMMAMFTPATYAQGKPALIRHAEPASEQAAPAPIAVTAPASEQIAQAQVTPPPPAPVAPPASEPTKHGKPALIKKAGTAPAVAPAPPAPPTTQVTLPPADPPVTQPVPTAEIEGPKKSVTIDPVNGTVSYHRCDSLWVVTNVPKDLKREQGPR